MGFTVIWMVVGRTYRQILVKTLRNTVISM